MIPWSKPYFTGKEQEYLQQALSSTWISGGSFVTRFEAEFAERIGRRYGVTCTSGTSALHLALLALGIGPGDEVIVPALTFVAPANMVLSVGATPVYASVNKDTWCIDPSSVRAHITRKTKAVIPVHLYGNVCEMSALNGIGVPMIEDAAEALFSQYRGKYVGSFGDLGCFSFQATKTITMGEGGIVLTDDLALYNRLKLFRDHGMTKERKYWHDVVGFNYRLTNLQAAVGCAQLKYADDIIAKKRHVYQRYLAGLQDERGITLQILTDKDGPVVWAVALQIDPRHFVGGREAVISSMARECIETRVGFYPFCDMPLYKAPYNPVETIARKIISLPSYAALPDNSIDYICRVLRGLRTCEGNSRLTPAINHHHGAN